MEPGALQPMLGTLGRRLAAALVLTVFFALIGPFGSYDLPFPRRLLVCFVYSLAVPLFHPVYGPVRRGARRLGAPEVVGVLAATLVITLPSTLYAAAVSRLVFGLGPTSLPRLYGSILSVAGPLGLAAWGVERLQARRAPAAAPERPRLMERLPAAVEGDILALEAEDHYVRVHTARGSTLILMRLSDAIAELDGLRGLQVHRSWWVARSAVTGAARTGRRAELVLSNGLRVPIARNAMAEARAEGLLGVRA